MLSCKWANLQNRCTTSSSHKSTIMHNSLYFKNNKEIGLQCSLSIFNTPHAFLPVVLMSNHCIFILTTTMQGSAITVICPDEVTGSLLFQQPIHILKLPLACSATSRHFHILLHYEDHVVTMHVSLDKANFNTVNISTPGFCIWQHFDSNWTTAHMQKLVDIPKVPITLLYKHMIGQRDLSYNVRSTEVWKKDPLLHGSFTHTQGPT